ncbi:MAG: hypothetical protein C4536_00675 [Actinobacteria bacterium]|nr:MAG: hypothetical protein C4536_00675 [Actinomycetota bacterium]
MKVQDIGPAIAKRIWIVIALVLISTLAAAIIAQVQSPVYKVEIAVSASAPTNPATKLPDANTQLAYVALMPSIANYAESISVADVTSQRLANEGIDIPPEELLAKVSAMAEANSTSVKITFSDGSPTRVTDIANAWGEVLVLKSNQTTEFYDPEFKNLLLQGNIVFTNRAVPPQKPTQPKTFAYIGLGFFIGLVLGLVLVILIEYFDPHFRSAREVEETLELPVLGTLPREKGGRTTALLPTFAEGSRTWSAYAELRSSLILSSEGAPKSIMAASAIPFEAGPAVAANLAVSIANTGRRTLLVDCDLMEGGLSRLMEAGDRSGLSDALEKDEDYRGKMVEGNIGNLSFLPAGKKSGNSTDLLSLTVFEDELREQEGLYDEVVLYAPPLIGSLDAAVVGAQAEASVVIIDTDRCTRKAALEAMHNFERLGIVPLGAVLANVKMKKRDVAPAERRGKPAPAVKAVPAAAVVKEKKKKERKREKTVAPPVQPREAARPAAEPARAELTAGAAHVVERPARSEPATQPVEEAPAPAKPREAPAAAIPQGAGEPSWGSAPVVSPPGAAADDLRQVQDSVAEDFRRMGETGAPIPKNWLRALNSDKADVRESATNAIAAYYRSFLRRYRISDESIERITESIIRMMRREDEFASMSEEEAQRHLRQMLVDAGAKFSVSADSVDAPPSGQAGSEEQAIPDKKDDRELRRQEKRRLRLDAKGGRRSQGKGKSSDEEGVDWE